MKAVINILKNASSVTNLLTRGQEGIFIGVAGKNAGKAYLTVNEDVIEPWRTKEDGADTSKVEYTIRVYAADALAAWNLANAVEAQLDVTTPGTYNNQGLLGSRLSNREQLDYGDTNRDEFGWELIFDTIVTDRSSAADTFTAITAFSYSNNNQSVSSGSPITAMAASVTGDVSYYVVDANDSIISGLSLNTSTGAISGTPAVTGSFDVVAVGKNGSSVGVVTVSHTVTGGTQWTPSDLTNASSRIMIWHRAKGSGINTSSYEGATNVDQLNDLSGNGYDIAFGGNDNSPFLDSDGFFETDTDSDDYFVSGFGDIDNAEIHAFKICKFTNFHRMWEGDSANETIYLDSPQLERVRSISSVYGDSTNQNLDNGHGELSRVAGGRPTLFYAYLTAGTNATFLEANDNEADNGWKLNLTHKTSGNIQFATSNKFNLGHDFGSFGEALIIEGSMTADEIERVKAYLAHDWGIESYALNDSNTYKSNPPTV